MWKSDMERLAKHDSKKLVRLVTGKWESPLPSQSFLCLLIKYFNFAFLTSFPGGMRF